MCRPGKNRLIFQRDSSPCNITTIRVSVYFFLHFPFTLTPLFHLLFVFLSQQFLNLLITIDFPLFKSLQVIFSKLFKKKTIATGKILKKNRDKTNENFSTQPKKKPIIYWWYSICQLPPFYHLTTICKCSPEICMVTQKVL